MPAGIIATVDNGFAILDFLDPTLRGPALAALTELGGAESIEPMTRSGPRKKYRVPADNAAQLDLLDGDEVGRKWSAGNDTGRAAALKASDPNVNAGGGENWHTPTDQYTSANKFVGKVANSAVLHNRNQVFTGSAGSFGGSPDTGEHAELIDYVKAAEDEAYANATPPIAQSLMAVSTINTMLGSQTGALGTDPGAQPDAGGSFVSQDYTAPETERMESTQDGQTNETLGGKFVPDPTDPVNVGDPDGEVIIEYPEGEPNDKWTRPELDAYALNVKGLDTTSLGNKAEVLAAINAPTA